MFDLPELLSDRQRVDDDGIEGRRSLVPFGYAVPELGDRVDDDWAKVEALDDGWNIRLISQGVDEENVAAGPGSDSIQDRCRSQGSDSGSSGEVKLRTSTIL